MKFCFSLFHFIFFSLYRFCFFPFFFLFLMTLRFLPSSFPFFSKHIKKAKTLVSLKNSFFHRLSQTKSQIQNFQNLYSKCIWFHAASGEFEYAKPIIREIKRQNQKTFILVTYFSPSYEKFIQAFPGVNAALPLPWDFPVPIQSLIKSFKPQCLLIARTDLWPEMLEQCRKRKIPSYLFSATCAPSFLKGWPFHLYSVWIYSFLKGIFCVSEEDKKNFQNKTGFKSLFVIGDTRYDQVLERLKEFKKEKDLKSPLLEIIHNLKLKTQIPYLIAGSTWEEDEKVLLEAFHSFLKKQELRMILVPHEPSSAHLKALELLLSKYDLKGKRLSLLSPSLFEEAEKKKENSVELSSSIFILDKIGLLAEVYLIGDLAFVGGSFKKSVHSVMEPLAAGCLSFVGPYHKKNREVSYFKRQILKKKSDSSCKTKTDPRLPSHKTQSSVLEKKLHDSYPTTHSLQMLYTFKNAQEIKNFFQMHLKNFDSKKSLYYKEQIALEVKKQAGATCKLLNHLAQLKN